MKKFKITLIILPIVITIEKIFLLSVSFSIIQNINTEILRFLNYSIIAFTIILLPITYIYSNKIGRNPIVWTIGNLVPFFGMIFPFILTFEKPKDIISPEQKNRFQLAGIILILVSLIFFGKGYHLKTQFKGKTTKRCNICGTPAEWERITYSDGTGKQYGDEELRCARHRETYHPGNYKLMLGFPFLIFGIGFLLQKK